MTWNYRIVRYHKDRESLGLHEVYYDETGKPISMTQPASFVCGFDEGIDGITVALKMALADAKRLPILDEPKKWPGFPKSHYKLGSKKQ